MLIAQANEARGEAIAAMKADGIEYDERMERLAAEEGLAYNLAATALGKVNSADQQQALSEEIQESGADVGKAFHKPRL